MAVQAHPITKAKNTYSDGRIYNGLLTNEQPNGNGTMTYPDGTTITDRFINGVPERHKPQAPKGDEGEPKKDNTYSRFVTSFIKYSKLFTEKATENQSFTQSEWRNMVRFFHPDRLPKDLEDKNQSFLDLSKHLNGALTDSKGKESVTLSDENRQKIKDAFIACTKILRGDNPSFD
ncbi:MAG: hypothetical protein ISQ13_02420 [Candidatus Margulisbacteria bacterium]|nr:hypothetical protein [Candidatus Margulisiibacteriota bacterium]